MAVNIDYGLGARQAAIGGWVDAEKGRANAEAEAEARKRKRARQQRKGLMTAALHVGAGIATGGASIPYSMKYGGMANKALMGDDYEGSAMQSVQGLGSMVYAGAEKMKAKAIDDKRTAFNNTQNSLYKALDGLPNTEQGQIEKQNISLQLVSARDAFEKDIMKMKQAPIWNFGGSEREKQILKTTGKGVQENVMVDQSEFKVDTNKGPSESAGYDSLQEELWKARQNEINQSKISIGHDLADMSDEGGATTGAQSFPMGPSSNKQQMAQRLETPNLGRDAGIMNTSMLPETNPADYNNNEVAEWQKKFRGATNRGVQDIYNQWNRYD